MKGFVLKTNQPKADWITEKGDAVIYRNGSTKHRGRIYIYAAPVPYVEGKDCGCIVGRAVLDAITPASGAPAELWTEAGYKSAPSNTGFLWTLSHVERLLPYPMSDQPEFDERELPDDVDMTYPEKVVLGDDGLNMCLDGVGL